MNTSVYCKGKVPCNLAPQRRPLLIVRSIFPPVIFLAVGFKYCENSGIL